MALASSSPEAESVRGSLEFREIMPSEEGVSPPRTHSRYHGRLWLDREAIQLIDGKPLILNYPFLDGNPLSCGDCHLAQVVYILCLVAPTGSHCWICLEDPPGNSVGRAVLAGCRNADPALSVVRTAVAAAASPRGHLSRGPPRFSWL